MTGTKTDSITAPLNEDTPIETDKDGKPVDKEDEPRMIGTDFSFKHKIVWRYAVTFPIMNFLALWGLYLYLTGAFNWKTYLWTYALIFMSSEGVMVGAHRLYSHRSFKAAPLLRAILILWQTMAGEQTVLTWAHNHRLHHLYSDTDADPHNAKRGFFFSHVGWMMSKRHPHVITMKKKIDVSDLYADWMIMFQKKYYWPIFLVVGILIPVGVPVYCFGESWLHSFLGCLFFRYMYVLHGTWAINSFSHLFGTRPYDKNIQPVESWFTSVVTLGEGWHNYHHAFPWDYKAAEVTMHLNTSASFIRFCEKIGLAWDLKTVSPDMMTNRILRTGDGSHYKLGKPEAQAAVTAPGVVHPLNPLYTTTLGSPGIIRRPDSMLR